MKEILSERLEFIWGFIIGYIVLSIHNGDFVLSDFIVTVISFSIGVVIYYKLADRFKWLKSKSK